MIPLLACVAADHHFALLELVPAETVEVLIPRDQQVANHLNYYLLLLLSLAPLLQLLQHQEVHQLRLLLVRIQLLHVAPCSAPDALVHLVSEIDVVVFELEVAPNFVSRGDRALVER